MKMIKKQNNPKENFNTKRYFNGQLGVYVNDEKGLPIAELSVMHDSVELAANEFILKDYSENKEIINKAFETEKINITDRYILIGKHICPICQISF